MGRPYKKPLDKIKKATKIIDKARKQLSNKNKNKTKKSRKPKK